MQRHQNKHKLQKQDAIPGRINQHNLWVSNFNGGTPPIRRNILALQCNPDPPKKLLGNDMKYMAAIVTAEHLVVIQISENGTATSTFQVFVVENQTSSTSTEEKDEFSTVLWVKDPIERLIWSTVCFAGSSGVIRIVDLQGTSQRTALLRGHSGAVNELSYCENHPVYLFSASKDCTIRLWSIRYLTCLGVFGGGQGHKTEITTLDFHSSGQFLVSGSESCIKIWGVFENEQLRKTVSVHAVATDPLPCVIHMPVCSFDDIHNSEISCVRWMFRNPKQHFVVSKAAEAILIWMPVLPGSKRVNAIGEDWQLCQSIDLSNNKFGPSTFALLQEPFYELAVGDNGGLINLYDLRGIAEKRTRGNSSYNMQTTTGLKGILKTASKSKPICVCSVGFSGDGALIIGGSDDGLCYMVYRHRTNSGAGEMLKVKSEVMDTDDT